MSAWGAEVRRSVADQSPAVRVLEIAAVEIEVAVNLLGPDHPGPTLAVAAQFRHQPVARLVVHGDRRLPGRTVEAPRHDRDAAVPVGGPGGPDLTVFAARQRREVVLVVGRRQRFRRRHPVSQHGAVEEGERLANAEVRRPQVEVALGRREREPRPTAGRHVDDDAGVVEVGRGAQRVFPLVHPPRVVHALPRRHRPGETVDRLGRMHTPVADGQHLAARGLDRTIPRLRFRVRDAEPDSDRDDVVARKRRNRLCGEGTCREDQGRKATESGGAQDELSSHGSSR